MQNRKKEEELTKGRKILVFVLLIILFSIFSFAMLTANGTIN